MEYAEFDGYVHISCFELEIHFWANLVLKITSFQDEIWCQVQFDMRSSVVTFICPTLDVKCLFGAVWGKFSPKNQNCFS